MPTRLDNAWCRQQFPALERQVDGGAAVYFDGPAGSQVPSCVIEAVTNYLTHTNANSGGVFATSLESEAVVEQAHATAAEFLGVDDPGEVIFGQNMTTLTFQLARSLGSTWRAGDEIVLTQLEHDANRAPWERAAAASGATVRTLPVRLQDCTLDLDALGGLLSERTRLVAVACASNAVGTVPPLRRIVEMAHSVGAEVFLDAVHFAPHALLDVAGWDCDYLACSSYKFFGPHVGILWGRRHRLEELPVEKVRPAPDTLPWRWVAGTPSYEGMVGAAAAMDYLASVGRHAMEPHGDGEARRAHEVSPQREALRTAFEVIGEYERTLLRRLLEGLRERPQIRVWGITDEARFNERVPTVSFTHTTRTAAEIAAHLAARGIFCWSGNFYAVHLTEALDLEPHGVVRIGILHYNTSQEIERLLEAIDALD